MRYICGILAMKGASVAGYCEEANKKCVTLMDCTHVICQETFSQWFKEINKTKIKKPSAAEITDHSLAQCQFMKKKY